MRSLATSVSATDVLRLVGELRAEARKDPLLVLVGPPALTAVLKRELARGGVADAVRDGGPLEGGAALVYVLAGQPAGGDREVLRRAERARLPVVAVVLEAPGREAADPPYVLAEHVVRVRDGSALPVDRIARALARAMGEKATPLAARLPVLREAVVDELIRRAARRNAVIGAAVLVPGADMPVLTLNQVRLLLRIADAYGFELDRERIPEVLGVIAGGLGLRSLARAALGLVPVAGWLVKGGIAYAGTKAVGEVARRYFAARAPVRRTTASRAVFPR